MIPNQFSRSVYTGEQMWDKVIDAGLGDALAMVRLGDSLELGGFLGYDFLKSRVALPDVPWVCL